MACDEVKATCEILAGNTFAQIRAKHAGVEAFTVPFEASRFAATASLTVFRALIDFRLKSGGVALKNSLDGGLLILGEVAVIVALPTGAFATAFATGGKAHAVELQTL